MLCGAGIVNKSDVTKALELGADGILVASGIIKSSSWYHKIEELSSALLNASNYFSTCLVFD